MALPEVERKVRQYGADIDSIWEILTGHSEELAHIKQAVGTVAPAGVTDPRAAGTVETEGFRTYVGN